MILENNKNIFKPVSGVIDDEYAYVAMAYCDVLCKISLSSGEVSLIKKISDEEGESLHLVAKYEDNLVLIPHVSSTLIVLNAKYDEIKRISIPEPEKVNYNRIHIYESKMYMLPIFRKDIAVVDLVTGEVSFIKLPMNEMEKYLDSTKEYGIVSSCGHDEKLYIMCSNPNIVVEYDCNKGTFFLRKELKGSMSMCFANGCYWIGKSDKTIVKYNSIDLIDGKNVLLPPDFVATNILPMSSCRIVGTKAIFWSFNSNMILRVDVITGECDSLDLPRIDFLNANDNERCGPIYISTNDTCIVFYSTITEELIISNVEQNTYKTIKIWPSEELKRTVLKTEQDGINLKCFLEKLMMR